MQTDILPGITDECAQGEVGIGVRYLTADEDVPRMDWSAVHFHSVEDSLEKVMQEIEHQGCHTAKVLAVIVIAQPSEEAVSKKPFAKSMSGEPCEPSAGSAENSK
eukprot:s959_g10.t1